MRRYKGRGKPGAASAAKASQGLSASEALPIIALIMLAAFLPVLIVLGPPAVGYLASFAANATANATLPQNLPNLSGLPNISGLPKLPSLPGNQSVQQGALSQDALRYYALKNKSCESLSKDFLVEAKDTSEGSMQGLSGAEADLASLMLAEYSSSQTVRTYVRGESMKKVFVTPSGNHTSIWKDGRIYQCEQNCTMRLLGDAGWQAHLDELAEIRSGCAHFGRTALPASVDMARLLKIDGGGRTEKNGFRCELFLISGDKAYAQSILDSGAPLGEDERAIVWSIGHLATPAQECLDDGTGVLVFRNITLDLTNAYRFDYAQGGYLHVSQQTDVTYFTKDVPESFLALPK
jgi:hypothetical protein